MARSDRLHSTRTVRRGLGSRPPVGPERPEGWHRAEHWRRYNQAHPSANPLGERIALAFVHPDGHEVILHAHATVHDGAAAWQVCATVRDHTGQTVNGVRPLDGPHPAVNLAAADQQIIALSRTSNLAGQRQLAAAAWRAAQRPGR